MVLLYKCECKRFQNNPFQRLKKINLLYNYFSLMFSFSQKLGIESIILTKYLQLTLHQ